MKHFWKPGILLLCGISTVVVVGGCSRNVASVPATAAAPEATTSNPPIAQSPEPATNPDETKPSATKPKASTSVRASKIRWEANLDKALERAKITQKPIMIDFYATWCGPCKMLDEQIYPAADVVQEAQNFISVKVDVDKETAIAQKYNVNGLPSIVFLDASGQEIHRQAGIDGEVSSFVELMQTARARVAPTAA